MKNKKTVNEYVVKVNNEAIFTSESLAKARKFLKNEAVVTEGSSAQIVKKTFTEVVMDNFVPKTTTVLVASDLGNFGDME